MLRAVLAGRLGIEKLVDQIVDLGDRPPAANSGRKVMTILSSMALGADRVEGCEVLRSGQTAAVLGHRAAAPSTVGTFLRSFTFGASRSGWTAYVPRRGGPTLGRVAVRSLCPCEGASTSCTASPRTRRPESPIRGVRHFRGGRRDPALQSPGGSDGSASPRKRSTPWPRLLGLR
jgi:hypothetical protein